MEQQHLVGQGFLIICTLRLPWYTPYSVGLLWTIDQPVTENCQTQHSQQTNIHNPGGIRTPSPSKRAAPDSCLRSRGHWDRYEIHIYSITINFHMLE